MFNQKGEILQDLGDIKTNEKYVYISNNTSFCGLSIPINKNIQNLYLNQFCYEMEKQKPEAELDDLKFGNFDYIESESEDEKSEKEKSEEIEIKDRINTSSFSDSKNNENYLKFDDDSQRSKSGISSSESKSRKSQKSKSSRKSRKMLKNIHKTCIVEPLDISLKSHNKIREDNFTFKSLLFRRLSTIQDNKAAEELRKKTLAKHILDIHEKNKLKTYKRFVREYKRKIKVKKSTEQSKDILYYKNKRSYCN